jgi:hypothetical protein
MEHQDSISPDDHLHSVDTKAQKREVIDLGRQEESERYKSLEQKTLRFFWVLLLLALFTPTALLCIQVVHAIFLFFNR